ncbi:MAG: TetR/AcrR family transcriptional regulator [Deltaproteobacteria bacterium]
MSRKEVERGFKRELIARSARELFLAKSYDEVTVQDIASAAEFGKGTIYQYFSSKEEILYYLIFQDMAESMENLVRDCSGQLDAYECLNIYISNQYGQYMRGNRLFLSFLRLMLEGNLRPEWTKAAGIIREQKLEYVAGIIARGQAEGIFIEADSLQLARALKNVVRGFTMEQLELQKKETRNTNDIELIKAVIFAGIMRKNDSG